MIQEIKSYKASDGKIMQSESDALQYELALVVVQALPDSSEGSMIVANAIAEILQKNDAKVSALLARWRKCNPHSGGRAA